MWLLSASRSARRTRSMRSPASMAAASIRSRSPIRSYLRRRCVSNGTPNGLFEPCQACIIFLSNIPYTRKGSAATTTTATTERKAATGPQEAAGFRHLHTMIRVLDLEKSLDFNTRHLGMKVLRRQDHPGGRFTLAFIGHGDESDHTVIELTHNWDQKEPTASARATGTWPLVFPTPLGCASGCGPAVSRSSASRDR